MSSELGAGLRYAYSRLDIIDRKASENFRSFTFIFGLLISLRVIGGLSFLASSGIHNTLVSLVYLNFLILTASPFCMAIQHKEISSLRFYRIDVSACDASKLPATPLINLTLPTAASAIHEYLRRISTVTVDRERRLALLGRLYSVGLALALLEAVMMFFAAGPLHNS